MKVAVVALLVACGCGTGPMIIGGDGGDLSVSGDGSMPPDLACLPSAAGAMVACGGASCTSGQLCCYPAGSNAGTCDTCCASGSVGVQCTSPTDCGGKPCCLEVVKSAPASAYCTATQDSCPSSLSVGSLAGLSGRTRMCNTDVDCTTGAVDSPYKICCNSTYFGMSQKVCFTKAMTTPGITCP